MKLEKSKTPVWNYLFAWEYPVDGGITAFHCSEIAFVFHNVNEPHIRVATGGGPVALALQDKVAGAWLSFAKTGNPGAGFKPWTAAEPNTMVLADVNMLPTPWATLIFTPPTCAGASPRT